jgi:hypothetical protein
MVAVMVPVAVALADRVAAVPEATDRIVAPAGMPVPVMGAPTSRWENVFAGPVRAALPRRGADGGLTSGRTVPEPVVLAMMISSLSLSR